jgi:hypothetical protein
LDFIHRWPLKTPYTQIVKDVGDIVAMPKFNRPTLVIDQTGVGKPVVDVFQDANFSVQIQPVVITGGHEINMGDDGAWRVPKKDLVSTVAMLFQQLAPPGPGAELAPHRQCVTKRDCGMRERAWKCPVPPLLVQASTSRWGVATAGCSTVVK